MTVTRSEGSPISNRPLNPRIVIRLSEQAGHVAGSCSLLRGALATHKARSRSDWRQLLTTLAIVTGIVTHNAT